MDPQINFKPTTVVAIIGINGFIAKHLAVQLLHRGYNVVGTVRSLKNKSKVEFLQRVQQVVNTEENERLRLYEADLLNEGDFDDIFRGCAAVFHTASPFFMTPIGDERASREQLIDPAVKCTHNVMQAAWKNRETVKRVVLTSSLAAVADLLRVTEGSTLNDDDWNKTSTIDDPLGAYRISKTEAERAALDFVRNHPDLELVVINPSYVMGAVLPELEGVNLHANPLTVKPVRQSDANLLHYFIHSSFLFDIYINGYAITR